MTSTFRAFTFFILAPLLLSLDHNGTMARADADELVPPWSNPNDVPLPSWAKSVLVRRDETMIQLLPGADKASGIARRGVVPAGVRLPLFGSTRGDGCTGRWLQVGPLAWVCSDATEFDPEPARLRSTNEVVPRSFPHGLPFRYFFVSNPEGAAGYLNIDQVDVDAPDQELESGFGVAIVEERDVHGARWGRTRHNRWVSMRDLSPARVSTFHGEDTSVSPSGEIAFGWVVPDKAIVYGAPANPNARGKNIGQRKRFQVVPIREERPSKSGRDGAMLRISDDGAATSEWMRAQDIARPRVAQPPDEIGAAGVAMRERWIDVDLASQTLVAYEGDRPVFATLVSTGIGAQGSETATPIGVHRVWVKLLTTNMDNLERDDIERHYAIEDVPYVQFFDRGVALHGAFWHNEFGRTKSHGCVNLAPMDAERLFAWTGPRLPSGWSAVYPTRLEYGTIVRVR